MVLSKDKLLESAQKSLKKKQVARAIKDYTKIVELDPGDVRSRQKLAELLVRTHRNADAYEHYESVAKYFSSNGFYLKAIAIFKQMQRLDPNQVSLFSRLAELNEKQGLIGNAMAEYRNLVSYYERNGMVADAIKVLEKMRDLDTANLNVRVKLAEVYALNERKEDGLVEFEGVLSSLAEKRDFDKILKLYKMFMPLYPNNQKLKIGLALTLYEKGELQKGVSILSSLLQDKPEDPDLLRLIARGYGELRDWPNAVKTYRQLLVLDPTDLDIRERYIKCQLDSGQYDQALAELEEWKESFFKADRLDLLKEYYELLKDRLVDSSVVLQTLDSLYELTGEGEKLLDIISEQDDEPEETVDIETLSDSLLGSADDDIELPATDSEFSLEESDELLTDLPLEEFDLQLEAMDEDDSPRADDESDDSNSVIELDLNVAELEPDAEEILGFSFDLSEDEEVAPAPPVEERNVGTDLEEAEFYIQQGLYVEAEKLCLDILVYAPDSEECQQKLADIRSHLHAEPRDSLADIQDLATDILSDDPPDVTGEDHALPAKDESAKPKIFRTDVDEQIAAEDMESHYNLGIAYREMGLLDDAVSEFEKAQSDPSRYVDCQTLKGLCFSEKGDFTNAEIMFQQALDSPHLEDGQRLSLSFELATLYETSERFEEALSSYRAVQSQDESYRDVKSKIISLQEKLGIIVEDRVEVRKDRISFL
ncbi:MAG: tetratricopeptide repeat protein [Deltaproteobacteria bacterium]|nr:tetratricopeptide repeat protein [Deltaproteobacteria bacterium]